MCRIVATPHASVVIGDSPALIAPSLAFVIGFLGKVFCKGDRRSIIWTGGHVLAAIRRESLDRQEERGRKAPDMAVHMSLLPPLLCLLAGLTVTIHNLGGRTFSTKPLLERGALAGDLEDIEGLPLIGLGRAGIAHNSAIQSWLALPLWRRLAQPRPYSQNPAFH